MPGVDAIDACLPQTQCQRCTYPCCKDYATAIRQGEANINQCPPGGDVTIKKLAELSEQSIIPLDPQFGEFQPKTLAFIIEEKCIGCVLCIKACPVDAIVGANKLMHSVIQAQCTGCELCIPVCPTDCIEMHALEYAVAPASDWPGYTPDDIKLGRIRHQERQTRLNRLAGQKTTPARLDQNKRKQAILDAVKRRQQRKDLE
jgi:electron transport complex protein RnfB